MRGDSPAFHPQHRPLLRYLPITLPTPAENLALDEVLLEQAASLGETFRLWESNQPMVVLGRSSRVEEEVELAECKRREVPVHRRVSGGATIVTGPGCLMYAVVLSIKARPQLAAIDQAHAFVLQRIAAALSEVHQGIELAGTSDLILRQDSQQSSKALKFSGNSLRVKRDWLLYHGTLLYDFDVPLIESVLRTPPRQPEYRGRRPHSQFITNLPHSREQLVEALPRGWHCDGQLLAYPRDHVDKLVAEKYCRDEWNLNR